MGQLVLLVVAAAWAAVLVPPLLRSRIENRPNSSVTDFRDQLSSLQRAMPSRGVAMRSMARPLAPSPLSRPAAAGRPRHALGRPHPQRLAAPARANGTGTAVRRRPSRSARTTPTLRSAATPLEPLASGHARRDAVKRRRANVLFVLVLTAGVHAVPRRHHQGRRRWCRSSVVAVRRPLGYVYLLGQLRQRDLQRELRVSHVAADPERRPRPSARRRRSTGAGDEPRRRTRSSGGTTGTPTAGRQRRPTAPGRSLVGRRLIRRHRYTRARRGAVAQLVERNNRTVEARGSIPLSSTRYPPRSSGCGAICICGISSRSSAEGDRGAATNVGPC